MRLRKRARPREVVTQSTLENAFDRRTFVIGTAMGGLGVLLAALVLAPAPPPTTRARCAGAARAKAPGRLRRLAPAR